ncbi:hypothetical protein CXB51_000327 [Gossypium anomalum]|uniref:DUF7745 domain-containing protein n=1 Tax=Gossypium anomalum TaxID=47600 RepID=A0A8J6DCH5_9ROSI|nr:hypothetical protein CXB51_000327 [Gossypium anomalum]
MTVVVTPLSGSEKLHLREVFASVQDSGSLSGYIRTYGIDSRSVSKLESFIMENGLLDRVEGNANVHRWSEQTQLEKGDSIAAGHMSELSGYTRISVMQNNLQELKEIWDQWGNETKQLFYAYSCFTFGEVDLVPTVEEYTALLRCPRFQVDRIYSRAFNVPTFWKKLIAIRGMSEQWITAKIKEKGECKCISWDALKGLILTHPDEAKRVDVFAISLYGLMVFPRALGYMDEATTDLFHRLSKRVTSVPAILAQAFRSLGTYRKAGADRFVGCAQLLLAWFYSHFRLIDKVFCQVFFEDYSPLKDIIASTRRVDVPEENWIALLQNLQSKDVEWRDPWMIPGEILYRCGSFDWVPLLGIWGAICYAPLLVLRQFGLRQFVLATHGLTQSEFAYRGADYKKRVGEISSAWNKTCRLKGVAIGPATTPEYVEWRGRRINDNILEPNVEGARPMEEYLQAIPSELEIMKQEFERKNLEFEKRIAKLEEEKMYLSLDIDVQKMEVEKERKEKRKIEEDRDDLKEHYKKAQVSLRRAKVGGSSDQLQKEVQEGKARAESLRWHRNHDSTVELKELKSKVEDLETALQEGKLWIKQLETQGDYLKGELHQSRGQDLAVRADVLSLMCGSSSDIGRELALLLDRVKTLGIRAKAKENLEITHLYGTRTETKNMDQKFEQLQKDMQDQLQEQLAKMQNEMREQMMEAQRNMVAEMAQLLRATDKGKAHMAIIEEENKGPPPGFTLSHVPLQTEAPPRRPSTAMRPQHGPIDAGVHVNFSVGSGFNMGDNPTNPLIPDLDMVEKEDLRAEAARQLDERCRWLEEKFKALEGTSNNHGVDAKDLSLVPNLMLLHKFKMQEFKKYNGTTCPEAHITMFCRRMTGYVNNDQLLIHYFQDSLIGAAARWYNQLSRARISS